MLYREPKLLKGRHRSDYYTRKFVSVLYREPKLLKEKPRPAPAADAGVSVLYREPKLLKAIPFLALGVAQQWFQCSTVSRNC